MRVWLTLLLRGVARYKRGPKDLIDVRSLASLPPGAPRIAVTEAEHLLAPAAAPAWERGCGRPVPGSGLDLGTVGAETPVLTDLHRPDPSVPRHPDDRVRVQPQLLGLLAGVSSRPGS